MSQEVKKKLPEFIFEVDKNIEGGIYSNLANVIHSKNEFLLDFALLIPGKNAAKVQARIITNPQHIKQFYKVLGNNIAHYENTFGEIKQDNFPDLKKTTLVN